MVMLYLSNAPLIYSIQNHMGLGQENRQENTLDSYNPRKLINLCSTQKRCTHTESLWDKNLLTNHVMETTSVDANPVFCGSSRSVNKPSTFSPCHLKPFHPWVICQCEKSDRLLANYIRRPQTVPGIPL